MKVLVHYRSGANQVFIVPREMNVAEFQRLAKEIGGHLRKIEFPSTNAKVDWASSRPGYRI